MNNSFTPKSKRNKEMISTRSFHSACESSEVDSRLTILEATLFKLSTQNEILIRRIEDLESYQSHFNKNSHDFKLDEDEISIEKNTEYKDTHFDLNEWKNDIEKSLEKISDRVAGNNPSAIINLLENQLNDFCKELKKLKKQFYEELEINSRNREKIEKTEKSVSNIHTQFSELKSTTNKWQSDVCVKMNILNERVEIEENSSDLFKEFIKVSNVKFENFSATIKNIIVENKMNKDHFDNKYFDRLKQLEEYNKTLHDKINSLDKMITEEFGKHEGIYIVLYFKSL